jgi:hypothetical protein
MTPAVRNPSVWDKTELRGPIVRDTRRHTRIDWVEGERFCARCGTRKKLEEFATDRSKRSGIKSFCKTCENEKSKAYYRANREAVLEKAAARRGRPRPPERTNCSECGEPLPQGHRVTCGKSKCREARFKRLQPENYAAREAAKVERRRERRRELRGRETVTAAVSS